MKPFYEYEDIYFYGKHLRKVIAEDHTCLLCAISEMCLIERKKLSRLYICTNNEYFEEI